MPKTFCPASLKAPKIAYDLYVKAINKDEDGLTDKQIEILRLISSTDKVLKKEIKSVSVLNKLIEYQRVEIVKEEKK